MLRALAREDAEARVRRAAVTRLDDVADARRHRPDRSGRRRPRRSRAPADRPGRRSARPGQGRRRRPAADRGRPAQGSRGHRPRELAARRCAPRCVDLLDDAKALGSISRHARDGATRAARAGAAAPIPTRFWRWRSRPSTPTWPWRRSSASATPTGWRAIAQRGAQQGGGAARARAAAPDRRGAWRRRPRRRSRRCPPRTAAARPSCCARPRRWWRWPTRPRPRRRSARVRLAWAELGADTEIDAALTERFEAASEAAREAIAERQQERAAEQIRAEAAAREQADRLRGVPGDRGARRRAAPRIASPSSKVRWDALPPIPQEYAASLTRRFQDACRAFEDRERRRMLAQAAAGRLQTLAAELEQLVASEIAGAGAHRPLARAAPRRRGAARARRGQSRGRRAARARDRRDRGEGAAAGRRSRQRQEQDNLRRLHQICRQVETLAARRAGHAQGRRPRARARSESALEGRLPLPTKKDRQEVQTRLEAARAVLGPRVQELRDADEWQRWANLQVQEELCQEDGGAGRGAGPRSGRPPHARAAGALEAGGAGAAHAGRGDVAPVQDGAGRGVRAHVGAPGGAERGARGRTWPGSRRSASGPRRCPTPRTG